MGRSRPRGRRAAPGRVLVAGASGFLGQAIVRAFTAQGWEVRGLVRDPAKADRVRAAGGVSVTGNVLDAQSLRKAASDCDAIVHVAANPSGTSEGSELPRRVRVEGTLNLIGAAESCRVRRLVVGSGYWVYADQPGPIAEDSELDPQGESRINYDAERAGLGANAVGELEVMVVRPGMVYGNGSWFRAIFDGIRSGTYSVIDGGVNDWSFVSLPDAGNGFFSVVKAGHAGQVYNLVDQHPSSWEEFAGYVAERLQRPPPPSISLEVAEKQFGSVVARHLAANRSASSAKLEAIGWRPIYPRFREGIDAVLQEILSA